MSKQMTQNATDYVPTPTEGKLLEVLLNPENRKKQISSICRIAGCDRATYYRAFRKPEFVKIYRDSSIDLVKSSIMPILHTFIHEAKNGSFQHGKVLLEMADIYIEKKQVDANNINCNLDDAMLNKLSALTIEELRAFARSE